MVNKTKTQEKYEDIYVDVEIDYTKYENDPYINIKKSSTGNFVKADDFDKALQEQAEEFTTTDFILSEMTKGWVRLKREYEIEDKKKLDKALADQRRKFEEVLKRRFRNQRDIIMGNGHEDEEAICFMLKQLLFGINKELEALNKNYQINKKPLGDVKGEDNGQMRNLLSNTISGLDTDYQLPKGQNQSPQNQVGDCDTLSENKAIGNSESKIAVNEDKTPETSKTLKLEEDRGSNICKCGHKKEIHMFDGHRTFPHKNYCECKKFQRSVGV